MITEVSYNKETKTVEVTQPQSVDEFLRTVSQIASNIVGLHTRILRDYSNYVSFLGTFNNLMDKSPEELKLVLQQDPVIKQALDLVGVDIRNELVA